MNTRRWWTHLGSKLGIAMMSGLLLATATGCGALGALSNPKIAFALSESAPLPVVVRRATTAKQTAENVDRLLAATPLDEDSEWVKKLAFTPEEATAILDTIKTRAAYTSAPLKVLPSEAWAKLLGTIKSEESAQPSMLTMVSVELGKSYGAIVEKQTRLAKLKDELKTEEKAVDDVKSDADKKPHEEAIAKLEAEITKAKDEVDPLVEKFLTNAKANAAKSTDEVRKQLGQAIVNLRQAVDDAKIANGAAVVRYPIALPGIKSDIQAVILDIVADILEEQTGKRPTLQGFKPEIGLDGTKVTLKLNGLSDDDLGKVEVDELLSGSVSRSTDWVGSSLSLLATASATGDRLSFQAETLDAIKDGFVSAGWTAPAPLAIAEIQSTPTGK
jgi:uncharacterized coiled-coil protein SlyX